MTALVPFQTTSLDDIIRIAGLIYDSGLAPNALRRPEQIAVVALKGQELGLPPMVALSHIHIIQGQPSISAELMRALVHRAGHIFRVVESTQDKAVVGGQRWINQTQEFGPESVATFTKEDAQQAGLWGKGNWKNYPKAMLVARATSILCREMFADVVMGAGYTPEELAPDAVRMNEQGEVIEVSVESKPVAAIPAEFKNNPAPEPDVPEEPKKPTAKQFAKFHAILNEHGMSEDAYRAALQHTYGLSSVKELTRDQLEALNARISTDDGIKKFMEIGYDNLPEAEVPA